MTRKCANTRLGGYRVISELAVDGTLTVRVERVLDGRIEAELTFDDEDRGEGPAPSGQGGPELASDLLALDGDGPVRTDDGELAAASVGHATAQSSAPGFPSRPGMRRSSIGPGPEE